jgi:hypothetical protein
VGIPSGNHIAYCCLCNYLQKFCLSKVDSQVMINETTMTYKILFLFFKICFCDNFLINWNSFIILFFKIKTSNNPIVINNQTTTNAHMLKRLATKRFFARKKMTFTNSSSFLHRSERMSIIRAKKQTLCIMAHDCMP